MTEWLNDLMAEWLMAIDVMRSRQPFAPSAIQPFAH
jgi:hypothetical protein